MADGPAGRAVTNSVSRSQSVRTSDKRQRVTGCLAFLPEALAAAAEEDDSPPRQRLTQRLAIHVTQHQHGAVLRVLDDGGQEAPGLVEVECGDVRESERGAGRRCLCSWSHLDAAGAQRPLEVGNGDGAGVKDTRGERGVDAGLAETPQ